MAPPGLSRIVAVAFNTHRETVRERVLYNLVFFAILMTLSGSFLGQLSIRQDTKIVKDIGLASMEAFGTLIALFIGVGLVAKEVERRSLYPLLAKPVTRSEFLLGKFCGLAFTLLVNVGIMALGLYLTLLLIGGRFDPGLLKAVYAIYLSLLLVVAIALFFSTFATSTLAAVATISLVVAGRFSDVIQNIQTVAPGVPRWLLQTGYYALPNFRDFDVKHRVVYGQNVSPGEMGALTLYAAAYMIVVLGAATASFRSRDLQ